MSNVSHIDSRIAEIRTEVKKLQDKIDLLDDEESELEHAKDIILQYIGDGSGGSLEKNVLKYADMTQKQKAVLQAVPVGKENRQKPAEIAKSCRSLSSDYVRTTLWRFARANFVESDAGFYWSIL